MNERQNQDSAEVGRRTELRSRIRPLSDETPDEVFLPFLELCFNWSMDKPRVERDELLERDDAAFYFKDWGRSGDIAVAAHAVEPGAEDSGGAATAAKDAFGDSSRVEKAPSAEDSAPDIVGLAWLRLAAVDAVVTSSSRETAPGGVAATGETAAAGEPTTAGEKPTAEGSQFAGYGWVATGIPELSLAVLPDHQSQGIGGMLLDAVCTLARMSGFPVVSLSVEDGNGAARLFQDRGFAAVGRSGDSDILVKSLK